MLQDLLIRIYSFSYHNQHLKLFDPAGNGGGFVFDCRALPNPHRDERLRHQTGIDEPVQRFMLSYRETNQFLNHSFQLILQTIENFKGRGFQHLQVAFGCTGGRHRSVFCAEWLSKALKEQGYHTKTVHWELEQTEVQYRKRRGMILAAGFGTRLLPLTSSTPKALIQVDSKTMLDWTVEALSQAGCTEIVINTHHHREMVYQWWKNAKFPNVSMELSIEPEILGTCGGIRKALPYLHSPNPVIIHNCDIWTDYPLHELFSKIENQFDPSLYAVLVVSERPSSSYFLVNDNYEICGISIKEKVFQIRPLESEWKEFAFSGIHFLYPQALEQMVASTHFNIIDLYIDWIKQGKKIQVLPVNGNWFDMGTFEKLETLKQFLQSRK
ncbi:MAG: sugar phosphate nucleotidyltransferase [bacterium]|nr:sugar phosphate nucleotidyltransferase [bacterium]